MFKNKNLISTVVLVLGIAISLLYFIYQKYEKFANSVFLSWLVTLIVGIVAIVLYIVQKIDNKKDAAKTILQEIKRAEKIISDYKEHGHFKFTKKIIATNSWANNMHYFIEEMPFENLDKISDLYSTGEYLDSIIKMVSDINFDSRIHDDIKNQAKEQVNQQLSPFIQKINNFSSEPQSSTSSSITIGNISDKQRSSFLDPIPKNINIGVNLTINSIPTTILFNEIVSKYEPIYNSDVVGRLKEIAKLK
ncbi:MAG: hypothetical protein WA055_01410 [Candidatus Moraniibacteriota bacterium]